MVEYNIEEDLERMDYGDPVIQNGLEQLRETYKIRGYPYRELMKSKKFGTVKYLLVELHDLQGTILITDLDTNNTYRFVDDRRRVNNRVRDWVQAAAA